MAIVTRQDIIKQVKMWSNRSDLTDEQLESFVYFAGGVASQILRVPAMENTVLLTVNEEGHVVIPFDFQELRSLTFAWGSKDSQPLERIAWNQFVNYYNSPDLVDAPTKYFSRQGSYWFLSSKPKIGSKLTCHYYRTLPDLAGDDQVNWLSDMSPTTYVFGALYYLYMFIQDEDRATYWKGLFNEELGRIQMLSDNSEYKGSALSVRSTKVSGE